MTVSGSARAVPVGSALRWLLRLLYVLTGLLTATAAYLGGVTAAEFATGGTYQGYVYQWAVLLHLAVGVAVTVLVGVEVPVSVGVAVSVGVSVGVAVASGVLVGVARGIGLVLADGKVIDSIIAGIVTPLEAVPGVVGVGGRD